MRALGLSLICVAILSGMTHAEKVTQPKEEWRQLFNGKDLEGWTPKIRFSELGVNYKDTFRVEDGVLKVSYDQYDEFGARFGHLFFNEEFSHYRLRVEYRVVGEQVKGGAGWARANSGIMIHGQDPKTMAVDQNFPASIEVQLLAGLGEGERPTCNLCTPGTNVVMDGKLVTRHCNSSSSPTIPIGEWVTAELEVNGSGKIKHYVNGKLVLEYEQPQYDPKDGMAKQFTKGRSGDELLIKKGTISLQSESHPFEFRKVEILVLDDK